MHIFLIKLKQPPNLSLILKFITNHFLLTLVLFFFMELNTFLISLYYDQQINSRGTKGLDGMSRSQTAGT